MTPRQLLWVDNAPVETTDSDHKHLTESDLPDLSVHACKWRDIGMYLGFQQTELDDIQARPLLCLLYTSPSPRDATLSRMPSSA